MDSLSQIALGAAVGVATMGRRTAVWKAALWGAVAGTLPDLDVLIDHGDPISNMVLHRAETHAPFWLTLFSLPFAALVARLHGDSAQWRRWWLALWLALVTHPLLDAMTVYGTQLALPFSQHPFGVGSVFIIDPLYTLPLLVGVVWALAARGPVGGGDRGGGRSEGSVGVGVGGGGGGSGSGSGSGGAGLRANAAGLLLSTAYLAWGWAAQQHVERVARDSLAALGLTAERLLVTPTPFNTVLWRVVAVGGGQYHEGFHSLLDAAPRMHFDAFDSGSELADEVRGLDSVRRIAAFSKGFYKLHQDGPTVVVSDLRMGQEPTYTFAFAVARRQSAAAPLGRPVARGMRIDLERGVNWLWRRARGEALPPPR